MSNLVNSFPSFSCVIGQTQPALVPQSSETCLQSFDVRVGIFAKNLLLIALQRNCLKNCRKTTSSCPLCKVTAGHRSQVPSEKMASLIDKYRKLVSALCPEGGQGFSFRIFPPTSFFCRSRLYVPNVVSSCAKSKEKCFSS